jgi:hypothetical protein
LHKTAEALLRHHLRDLETYALIFPHARPRLAIVRALASGGPRQAIDRLAAAERKARATGMGFEGDLARQCAAAVSQRV